MIFQRILINNQRNKFQFLLKSFSNLNKFSRKYSSTTFRNSLDYLKCEITYPIMASSSNNISAEKLKDFPMDRQGENLWMSKEKRDDFMSYLPGIIDELEAKAASFDKVQNGKRMRRLLEYITPGSNGFVGIVTAETYKVLTPPSKHTPENLKLANYLGWCCEMFKNNINTGDDIIDRGQTRRNRACWYRLEDIGLTAINDAFLLDLGKNYLIGKYFRHLDCYPNIVEIFNETSLATYIGQQTDLYCSKDISKFTIENYQHVCINGCTYGISYMPVALGVTLAGIDPEVLQKAGPVLTQLGYFYLIDHDYMDCFGNSEVNGKIGIDIQEGKCRWLAVVCMELASPEQKDLMRTHYGRDDPESIAAVKQLYIDLNLQQVFTDYTADLHERLMTYIRKNLDGGIQEVCFKLTESLFYSKLKGKSIV